MRIDRTRLVVLGAPCLHLSWEGWGVVRRRRSHALASWSTSNLLHGGDRGDRAAAILIASVGLTILLVIEALRIQRARLRSDACDHRERNQQRENGLHGRSSFYGGDANSTTLSLIAPQHFGGCCSCDCDLQHKRGFLRRIYEASASLFQ